MCRLFVSANEENPICIGHPFQQSTSGDTVTFSGSVRILLRHWQLILRILHIWHMKSRLRHQQLILRILCIWHISKADSDICSLF